MNTAILTRAQCLFRSENWVKMPKEFASSYMPPAVHASMRVRWERARRFVNPENSRPEPLFNAGETLRHNRVTKAAVAATAILEILIGRGLSKWCGGGTNGFSGHFIGLPRPSIIPAESSAQTKEDPVNST